MNNKESTTAARLRQILTEKGLTQADVIKLAEPFCKEHGVKMNKSSLSQYCNGRSEPLQDKIYVLARALDVSEGWLMGYDVPRRRPSDAERFSAFADEFNKQHPHLLQPDEQVHLDQYRHLSQASKRRVDDFTDRLLSIEQAEQSAQAELLAAHKRTDIEVDEAMLKHDEEIMKDF